MNGKSGTENDRSTENVVQKESNGVRLVKVTDCDADISLEIAQNTSNVDSEFHQHDSTESSFESISKTPLFESEEEDREIIESLTKAHSNISEITPQFESEEEDREIIESLTKAHSNISEMTPQFESEEEDREIIESLTKAHSNISEMTPQFESEEEDREIIESLTKAHSNISETTPLSESKEEDTEIIESLTKAHSNISEMYIDIDGINEPTKLEKDNARENHQQRNESSAATATTTTDDDITDMEVSHLTSLIESKVEFLPLYGAVKFVQNLQSVSSTSFKQPPGKLPDISNVNIPAPRRVPVQSVTNVDDPALDEFAENRRCLELSDESSSDMEIPEIMTRGNIGAASFGLIDSSNHGLTDSSNQCSQCSSLKVTSNSGTKKICRLVRQYPNSSSYVDEIEEPVTSEGCDEHPPKYWKLYDSNSPEKSNGSNKHKLNETTDENTSST